jgi:hypothetical protein
MCMKGRKEFQVPNMITGTVQCGTSCLCEIGGVCLSPRMVSALPSESCQCLLKSSSITFPNSVSQYTH